ncbi:MAG: alpha/beta hydrolase [Aquihabitans sp.]
MPDSVRVPSTDGVDLALHDLGGDGPPLLIAHATGFCAGAYRPLAQKLTDHHHVWALDFRGHGDSTLPDGLLSWEGMTDDVLAVVDALDAGPIPAFGHSMGGACLLAAERRRPGTFSTAFVFEPIIFPQVFVDMSTTDNPLSISAARRRPSFASRAEALARYASRPPLGRFRADVLWNYVEHGFREAADGTVTLKCSPETEAATFLAPGKPAVEQMDIVATPTVVAFGTRDASPGPADMAPLVADALPNGTPYRYEHLSHFGPFEDPDSIAEDVRAHLISVGVD